MRQQRKRTLRHHHIPRVRLFSISMLILSLIILLPSLSTAFHDGGVADCSACHVLHVSQDGNPVDPGSPFGNEMILKYPTVGELCLTCHANFNGAVFSLDPLAPAPEKGGGNFIFLLEDNLNDALSAQAGSIGGHRAGHSLVSPGDGIFEDPTHSVSPGGSYPSNKLTCTSCHDPHGNENFRMLRGIGSVDPTGLVFLTPAPTGAGISLSVASESITNHTAYQAGWSAWCGNCHGRYHDGAGSSTFIHPIDEILPTTYVTNYNGYDGPSNTTGGEMTTAYLPQVPFEDPSNTTSSTTGPTITSRIACITCHRSHATSAVAGMRWDSSVRYLNQDGFISGSFPIPDPYLSTNQRPLCVKCHVDRVTAHASGRGCTNCH